MAKPYSLTLEDIQQNENLQDLAAMPGDEILNNKLVRKFSSEEDSMVDGYKLTEQDIIDNPNLQEIEAKPGDRVVDNQLKRTEKDNVFKQMMYQFDKTPTDINYLADVIESKIPFGLTRKDYVIGLLNPQYLARSIQNNVDFDVNFSDGISGKFTKNPDNIWGEGFMKADPQTRREMIARKYERDLVDEYGHYFEEDDGAAGVVGMVAGAVSSPTSVIPFGKGLGTTAIGGAGISGGYSVLEDLALQGEINPEKAFVYGVTGAGVATGLGLLGRGISKGITKRREAKIKKAEEQEIKDANKTIDEAEQRLARDIEVRGYTPSAAVERLTELNDVLKPAIALTGRKLKVPQSKSHAKQILQDAIVNDSVITRKRAGKIDQMFGSLLTRIRNESEATAGRLRKYELDLGVNTAEALNKVRPFLDNLRSLSSELKVPLTRHLFNGNFDEASKLMGKSDVPEDMLKNFEDTKVLLNKIFKESKDSGIPLHELENYFPRIVKDYNGLLTHFGTKAESQLDRMFNQYAERIGKTISELTPQEREIVANQYARGYRPSIDNKPRFSKSRKVDIDYLGDEAINKFYETPEDSLSLYIRNAINNIEKYKFFGRNVVKNKKGFFDTKSSIGSVVQAEKATGKLKNEDILADLLQARFIGGEQQMTASISKLRDLGYMGTIANPYSAITQFGDLGNSGALHGFKNTISSMFGEKDIKLPDIGIEDISSDLAEGNIRKTARALNWLFDKTGFRKVDRLGKETLINAAFKKAIKQVETKEGESAFRKEWSDLYSFDPNLIDNLINDLKNFKETKKITPDIKFHAFNELAEVQPISLSEMPQGYLNNPDLRFMYSLKTFTLKQIDVVRKKVIQQYKKGNKKEAFKNAALLAGYLSIMNTGTKTVKDLITGRDVDPDRLGTDLVFGLLGVYGMNEYNVERLAQDGDIISAAGRIVAPPLNMLEALYGIPYELYKQHTDEFGMYDAKLEKYMRDIPGVGPFLYNWFGGGAEKYNERLFDRKFDL